MARLTPYDTGQRAEPHVWPTGKRNDADVEDLGDYGKVDFDNDEGGTITTIYVERDDDGVYVVHVSGDVVIRHTQE